MFNHMAWRFVIGVENASLKYYIFEVGAWAKVIYMYVPCRQMVRGEKCSCGGEETLHEAREHDMTESGKLEDEQILTVPWTWT